MKKVLIFGLIFILLASFTSAILTDDADLIAFWPMNEGSGNLADDSTNSYTMTAGGSGTTYNQKALGPGTASILFDGSGYFSNSDIDTVFNTEKASLTIIYFIEPTNTGELYSAGTLQGAAANGFRHYFRADQTKTYFDTYGGSTINADATLATTINQPWCMAYMLNATGGSVWRNGTEQAYNAGEMADNTDPYWIAGSPLSGASFVGYISYMAVFGRSLSSADINDYCDNGLIAPVPQTINLSAANPLNNTQFNNNIINFNLTMNNSATTNCSLYINATYNQSANYTSGTSSAVSFSATLSEGDYEHYFNCSDVTTSVITTTNTFFVDSIIPSISWVTPSNLNTTIISGNLTANITIADDNLYSYEYNITYLNGTVIYNDLNTTLTGLTSVTLINKSTLANYGTSLKAVLKVCDGHTKELIEPMEISLTKSTIEFEGMEITSLTKDAINTKTTKLIDRYNFEFEYSTPKYSIEIEVPEHCQYIGDKSEYKGHFVCNNQYWLDFEGDYEVTVNDNKVTVVSDKPLTKFNFNSIGELNCKTEEVIFNTLNTTYSQPSNVIANNDATFNFNVSYNSTAITPSGSTLWYNSTANIMTETLATNLAQYTTTITTLDTNSTINLLYQFEAGYQLFNTTQQSQTIWQILLDNCSTYPTNGLNFTIYNDTTAINGSATGFFTVENGDSFNLTWTENNLIDTHAICFSPHFASFNLTGQLEYNSDRFEQRVYYLSPTEITNTTQSVGLYFEDGTSQITFTVTDTNGDAIEEVYIHIQKYDIGTDTSTTVEIIKTDSSGVAIGNLIKFTQLYRFVFVYNSSVVKETSESFVLLDAYTFEINLDSSYWDTYDSVFGVSCSDITFTNSTLTFSSSFTDTGSTVTSGCLSVIRRSINGDTEVNQTCITASSGSISLSITEAVGDNTYLGIGSIFVGENEFNCGETKSVSFDEGWKEFGDEGLFYSFFILLTLVLVGVWSPVVSVALMIIGVVALSLMGLFHLSWTILISFIIVGGIAIYKLK